MANVPNIFATMAAGNVPGADLDANFTACANPPAITVLTSGSGTYTTPTGATKLWVRMIGGGGGGGGSGTSPGAATDGVNTTFGTLTAGLGSHGIVVGGTGGIGTNGDLNIPGTAGGTGTSQTNQFGGGGGQSVFASAGTGGAPGGGAGGNAGANSGSGGGGAGDGSTTSSGGGGGAGAYVEKLITSPNATYLYAVGGGGTGGTAGTNGFAGGNGAAGIIIVIAF